MPDLLLVLTHLVPAWRLLLPAWEYRLIVSCIAGLPALVADLLLVLTHLCQRGTCCCLQGTHQLHVVHPTT